MSTFQESTPILDRNVTSLEIDVSFADRLDLGTEQHDTRLILVQNLVIEKCLLVLVNDFQYNNYNIARTFLHESEK